jgi:hypothetical protein
MKSNDAVICATRLDQDFVRKHATNRFGEESKIQTITSVKANRKDHMKISIKADNIELTAQLNDNSTAKAIADNLPVSGNAKVWGDEIYFEIPVALPLADDAVEEVETGTLAYWPSGKALCIFFGPTPVSTGERPRAYSPVNVFGKILEDATTLKKIATGTTVRLAPIGG